MLSGPTAQWLEKIHRDGLVIFSGFFLGPSAAFQDSPKGILEVCGIPGGGGGGEGESEGGGSTVAIYI